MRLRIGMNVSAPLMYALSWILLGAAIGMVVLAIATALGVEWLPIAPLTDLILAAICSGLALMCRTLARRFEHEI